MPRIDDHNDKAATLYHDPNMTPTLQVVAYGEHRRLLTHENARFAFKQHRLSMNNRGKSYHPQSPSQSPPSR